MVLSLMTLLVRLECRLGCPRELVGQPERQTRLNQSGFDAESHGLRRGAQAITGSDKQPQTTSKTRETHTEEITRRDDLRTEHSDHRPHEPALGCAGRYARPRRSFEC